MKFIVAGEKVKPLLSILDVILRLAAALVKPNTIS